MHKAQPDLSTRQLRAFLALADRRHFTRAAEACHLSQPAFSALIRALETSLNTRLFDRNTRSVQLTPEGRLFEPSARRLLADVADALQDLDDQVERRRGRVHMAALPSLAAGWLPPVLAEFHQRWPGVELELSDRLSDACLDLVRGGQADFALASADARGAEAMGLHLHPLHADRFHLVCRADHPLAGGRRPSLRRIAEHPFVHMTRNSSVRQALEAALHPLTMKTVLEVEQLATVTGLVEAGLGISIVPELTLYQFRRPGLVARPLALAHTRAVYLVRRREGSLSVAAQTLHDLVISRLGSLARG
ncbi:LysR family transcriptional regulator [Xylophilus rhododendri]|uniref:LysR family transcriptional regulator n=1 Tax=Xylophilus rhododendri TaxID=2697032 RepID=A0A857JBE0_9BURK|nr:LysR family transcriptional regulator [Xylophilus rhododendri]QHJ01257.1 LysR family transcriptional regulator [Xylophilus rhododendri]